MVFPSVAVAVRNAILSKKSPKIAISQPAYSTEIPKNVLKGVITADAQPENGAVYDKRPFKLALEAGKRYSWCLCGRSKSQPLCDGTHRMAQLKIKQKPIKFAVEESKEYWLCNCKHTSNRPFCDGTHKTKRVQDQNSVVKH